MANEAVLIHETGLPIPFTVADGNALIKGAILKMADPMTASIGDVTADLPAGILAEEKIASDGRVRAPVYRQGIFRVIASGSVTIGDPLAIGDTASDVYTAPATIAPKLILGTALETATNNETFLMELHPNKGGAQVS